MYRSITLFGMSNVGKSYWRKKLAAKGFVPFCCDDLIERRLEPHLKANGYHGIADVAKWMGYPFEARYAANSRRYLACEIEVMREAIHAIQTQPQNLVVDPTASVIHTGYDLLALLRGLTLMVAIDTPESHLPDLERRFFSEPKPVLWGKSFRPLPGEEGMAAVTRCYPQLLRDRNPEYRRWAHVLLDYAAVWTPGLTANDFLALIRKNLRVRAS